MNPDCCDIGIENGICIAECHQCEKSDYDDEENDTSTSITHDLRITAALHQRSPTSGASSGNLIR
jgi:hypothetical protein